jgi:hypothetical protein
MTNFDRHDPRLQRLERRVNCMHARLGRTRHVAMTVVACGVVPFVTWILGWVLGRWWRSRRWEHDVP